MAKNNEETKNEEEYDICVSCGKVTSYKKTDNIVYRSGYIEGAGQLSQGTQASFIKNHPLPHPVARTVGLIGGELLTSSR